MQQLNFSRIAITLFFFCGLFFAQTAFSQATLSIQGIIRKSNGAAVDDGKYDLTFKLYNATTGGAALHTETQNLQVTGGIYSAELGSGTPLTAAFDQTYYLGVSVDGGAELVPRVRLTSSPYALSLLGTENLFSSAGAVGVGTISPTSGYKLHAKNASGAGKILLDGSTAAQMDFKKGSTIGSIGFGSSSDDFVLNPGANNTILQYNGSAKLTVNTNGADVSGTMNVGTLNATTINGAYAPATMTVSTRMAVGQANLDNNYALKVNGQMHLAGGGLRVDGYIPGYQPCGGCAYWHQGGAALQNFGNNWGFTAIRASGNIDAASYFTQSDRRIKTNLTHPSGAAELNLLMRLQPTDYKYIDQIANPRTVKGFVAQEVKEILPEAINFSSRFIPSVYAMAVSTKVEKGNLRIEMDKSHGLKVGDKVRLYASENAEEVTVAEVVNDRAFIIANWAKPTENVFVFGKEINDFHSIDFDQILALNVSSTQELARQVEELKKENAALKAENGQMKASTEKLDARLRALESMMNE